MLKRRRLATLDQVEQLVTLLGKGFQQRLAKQFAVVAVTGQEPGRADDADLACTFIERLVRLHAELLQAVEADIDAHHADHLAVQQQGKGDAGHEDLLAADIIEVRVQHTGRLAVARAGVPGVVGRAAGAGRGVGELLLGEGLGLQFANLGLAPVQREATLVVAAQFRLANEQIIFAVQGISLEHHIQAQQIGVAFQCRAHLASHVFAQVKGVKKAFFRLGAQEQHLAREAFAVLVGVHEVALDLQRLGLGTGLHAQLRRLFEHLAAGLLDHFGAAARLVQGGGHQQGHDHQQAKPGQ